MRKKPIVERGERYIRKYERERKKDIDDVTMEGEFQHIGERAKVTDDSNHFLTITY